MLNYVMIMFESDNSDKCNLKHPNLKTMLYLIVIHDLVY